MNQPGFNTRDLLGAKSKRRQADRFGSLQQSSGIQQERQADRHETRLRKHLSNDGYEGQMGQK